jgi:hypothetical protein
MPLRLPEFGYRTMAPAHGKYRAEEKIVQRVERISTSRKPAGL